jgi:DNA-binding transcriptional MerR regulator
MNKDVTKSLIVELKEGGKSFQEISDILLKDYKIKMSRQAVCGMYKRTIANDTLNKNKELILLTNDICHWSAIGLNSKEIKDELAKYDYDVTIRKIDNIIENNSETIETIREKLTEYVSELLNNNSELDNIIRAISFKRVKPKNKELMDIIEKATMTLVKDSVTTVLANVYSITERKNLIKSISETCGLDITVGDVVKQLNA